MRACSSQIDQCAGDRIPGSVSFPLSHVQCLEWTFGFEDASRSATMWFNRRILFPELKISGGYPVMGRQMKAEREKRAVILEAEGQRQSAILKAEGQKQSQILEAEGRREAAFRDAEARERSAQAEAKATEMVSSAIASGDVTAINYFVADKYMKVLAELADSPNQKVLIMPMEVTGVLGSLAGIAEIAKATFGPDGRPPSSTPGAAPRRPTVPTTTHGG